MRGKPNRLIHEKSPYLLQHAYNPVDWYAWGDEAFERAAREDKPVFLSIGYSTCHWCHVMEHESFENDEVARLMNEAFVNIKVDREERPDIDGIYMTVCQMINQHGGWPLTILMTPDKKPFFAGTYIPRTSRHGRLGMLDFIPRIQAVWQQERDKIDESAGQITEALRRNTQLNLSGDAPGPDALEEAYQQLAGRFDEAAGGFSQAPKFPTPHNLMFLLRYWKRTGTEQALRMVEQTLDAMRLGGLYDHVGFGFHRYATDRLWRVPHFEKMLYDQALLVLAYTEAYQATGRTSYAETVREVLAYVQRDMQAPEGGFYSAEDADSEGEEGKFYVWTTNELEELLGEQDAQLIAALYNTRPEGNFKEEATGRYTGANHFFMTQPLEVQAEDRGLRPETVKMHQERVRARLFEHRMARIHPHKDDKILADWNGLMIAAFAQAGRVFAEPNYVAAAERAATFILSAMCTDGRLLHRYRDGEAGLTANLDDYAFMIHGLIELYQATFSAKYLKSALELTRAMIDLFWDEADGGFFFTPNDGEPLLVRQKETYDGAVPSGNSVAMLDLIRLGRITGDTALEERADALARAVARSVRQIPSGHCWMMSSLEFLNGTAYEVVIVGDLEDDGTKELLAALNRSFLPNKVVVLKPLDTDEADALATLVPYLTNHEPINDRSTAYVCRNYTCDRPTNDVETMLAQLGTA